MALPQTRRSSGNFTGANEGGFSSGLWAKFEKLAPFALYNRFVVALTAGTLEAKYLEDYIDQDVYFLKSYIEACELAKGCADDKDDKNEYSFTKEEAEKYCEELEKRRERKHAKENPNKVTLEYSKFLLEAAAGKVEGRTVERTKIPAYTIATLIPCSKLYGFMGKKIAEAMESDNPYKEWIKLIFPTEDEGSPLRIEEFLDKLSKPLTGEERELAGRIYRHAFKLDIDFFFALSFDQRTLVPLLKEGYGPNHPYMIVIDSSAILSEIATLSTLKAGDASLDYQGLYNLLKAEIEENSNSGEPRVLLKEINHSKVDMHISSVPRSADHLKAAFSQDGLEIHSDDMGWSSTTEHTSIYIGRDSDYLLKADIGIMIGATAVEHFRMRIVPLFLGLVTQERGNYYESWIKDSDVIYNVSSWSEIYAFLLGPRVSS